MPLIFAVPLGPASMTIAPSISCAAVATTVPVMLITLSITSRAAAAVSRTWPPEAAIVPLFDTSAEAAWLRAGRLGHGEAQQLVALEIDGEGIAAAQRDGAERGFDQALVGDA